MHNHLISWLWVGSAVLLRWIGRPLKDYDVKNPKIVMVLFSALFSFMGVLFSAFMMINSLRYGSGGGGFDFSSVTVGFAFSLCTFVPGIAWVAARDSGLRKQLYMAGVVSLSIIFLFLIMTPDIRKVVVFNAGKVVGLYSDEARQYIFIGSGEEIVRWRSVWPQGSIDENGLFVGKQLFSMAGAELICPSFVILNAREMLDLKRGLGTDCILLRSSQIIKGQAILIDGAGVPEDG